MTSMSTSFRSGQHGAVLVVGLIMLVVISLLGAVAYGVATQQERMSGNARDRMFAFDMAESALRRCEQDLRSPAFAQLGGLDRPAEGMYTARPAGDPPPYSEAGFSWASNDDVREWDELPPGDAVYALRPACIAEDLGLAFEDDPACAGEVTCPQREIQNFRVTARGFGIRIESIATVQSTIRR
jgi:type IV pilus assembly protein PilX